MLFPATCFYFIYLFLKSLFCNFNVALSFDNVLTSPEIVITHYSSMLSFSNMYMKYFPFFIKLLLYTMNTLPLAPRSPTSPFIPGGPGKPCVPGAPAGPGTPVGPSSPFIP